MFNKQQTLVWMCQLLVLKNELYLTAWNIKTSLDGSTVLPWQVMCISCLLLSVRRGTASTWSMPTTKRGFLRCNKVPVSLSHISHKGCSSTKLNHISHKLQTAVLTRWKLLSQEISWENLSPLLGSLAYMCWCFRGTCDFHQQSRDGSSKFLWSAVTVQHQCSWTSILGIWNFPWLPISVPSCQPFVTGSDKSRWAHLAFSTLVLQQRSLSAKSSLVFH